MLLIDRRQEENPRCVFVSSYTYAKNPVKRVKSGVYYGEANDLITEKDDHPHVNQESVSNETKESAGDETQQNPPHTTTPTATVQIDPNRLWVRRDEYKRFASYFRSKYIVTSYALYLSRHQPSLKTVICDPGVAATNIARELGFIGKLYALPFFQLFAPTAKGACTIAFAAGSGKVAAMESGVMLKNCRRKELIRQIRDVKEQEAIRKVTMDVIQSIECCVCLCGLLVVLLSHHSHFVSSFSSLEYLYQQTNQLQNLTTERFPQPANRYCALSPNTRLW